MPSGAKGASSSGKKARLSTSSAKATPTPLAAPTSDDSATDSGLDEDGEDGVNEAGMKRLMAALGDDGLDDYEMAQLAGLNGGSDDEDGGEVEADSASDGGDAESLGSASEVDEDVGSEDEGKVNENPIMRTKERVELDVSGVEDNQEHEEEDEDAVPLDEVESVDDDAVPRQKIEIDNKVALDRIRESIKLDPSLPWTETLVLSYPESISADVEDDLNREVAFYKQALHCANAARTLATQHTFPFTRPEDYFAEMVKSDAHMERIRQRLLDESAGLKRAEQKRKEREGKKFGKQIQLEKARERERGKKEMEEKLKGLKRKRKGALENAEADDDTFDVAVEDALADRPAKRGKSGTRVPRNARDKKFGFGGAGRRAKQNTKESTDDFGGSGGRGRGRGGARGGRGGRGGGRGRGAKRLGKSRRQAMKG